MWRKESHACARRSRRSRTREASSALASFCTSMSLLLRRNFSEANRVSCYTPTLLRRAQLDPLRTLEAIAELSSTLSSRGRPPLESVLPLGLPCSPKYRHQPLERLLLPLRTR